MAGCAGDLDSLLPIALRADLRRIGWNVEVEGSVMKVTRSGSEHSTRIQDFYQGDFAGMDLTTIESPRKKAYFLLAPDVVYQVPTTCFPGGPTRPITAQQQKEQEEQEDDDDW